MLRLVQTSSGFAMLDLDRYSGPGLHLRVTRFGSDGWEEAYRIWFEKTEMMTTPQTLERFLATELSLPDDEAMALAEDILGPWMKEWEARGGAQDARKTDRLGHALMLSLAVLIVLALVGIGLLIWLLAT